MRSCRRFLLRSRKRLLRLRLLSKLQQLLRRKRELLQYPATESRATTPQQRSTPVVQKPGTTSQQRTATPQQGTSVTAQQQRVATPQKSAPSTAGTNTAQSSRSATPQQATSSRASTLQQQVAAPEQERSDREQLTDVSPWGKSMIAALQLRDPP